MDRGTPCATSRHSGKRLRSVSPRSSAFPFRLRQQATTYGENQEQQIAAALAKLREDGIERDETNGLHAVKRDGCYQCIPPE